VAAGDPLHNYRHARSSPKRDDLTANTTQRVLQHTQGVWWAKGPFWFEPEGAWFCGPSTAGRPCRPI